MSIKDKIKGAIKPGEWVCFGDVLKRLGSPKFETVSYDKIYRAWQELKIEGFLSLGVSGLYRINQ